MSTPSLLAAAAVSCALLVAAVRRRRRAEANLAAEIRKSNALLLHRIKNPLQTIVLNADLLQDDSTAESAESRAEICSAIVSQAERLRAVLQEFPEAPPRAGGPPGRALAIHARPPEL